MSEAIKNLINTRVSTNFFDTNKQLSDDEVNELVALATRAPSAYNLQNWKFIAVRSNDAKERLKAVSYGQQKVVDASITFIICGTLEAYKQLPQALQPSLDAGIIEPSMAVGWVAMAEGAHTGNPILQRDEAVRSASLAAMTLMLAAEGMGFATGSMSGFDPVGVTKEFNLSVNEVPVIFVTVGYPAAGNWPQKPRKAVRDVLEVV